MRSGSTLASVLALALAAPAVAQPQMLSEPAETGPVAEPSGASGGFEYLYDDGVANVNIGPPSTFDPDMLWGNYFDVDPDGAVITEIAVAFGPTFPSLDVVTFWLLEDADADGDPRNARAVASAQATPDVFGNEFFRVPISPTPVSGAFFVGASAQLLGGQDRPARVDTDARADRSWFFYAPDIAAIIDDLASAPFGTRMDDPTNVPFPGAFMVRAVGTPSTTDVEAGADLPSGFSLSAAYPNPFNPSAAFTLSQAMAQDVTVVVVDALGRQVAALQDGPLAAGTHTLRFDAADLPSGVYVVRAVSRSGVVTQRVTLLR